MNIDRFRWTPEEKMAIFQELALDVDLRPPTETELPLIDIAETGDRAQEIINRGDRLAGLSTGYSSIDAMTNGFSPGDLIVVFGQTSHGKSQLCQNMAYRIAARRDGVLFVGLEMTNEQNTVRFIQIADQSALFLPIYYPKTNTLTKADLAGAVAAAVAKDCKLVIIDQLQQLSRNVDNLANELSAITHEVKRVAVTYKVPIILISHVNRGAATDKPPTLSDLKGSGSIEQDADICLAVWRDFELDAGELEVVQRKNRNFGGVGKKTSLNIDGVKLSEKLADLL